MAYYTATISNRINYAFLKAFTAIFSVGLGAEIAKFLRHEPSRLFQYGNLLIYIVAFVLIFIFLTISQDKISIKLTNKKIEVEIEKQKLEYAIDDIENISTSGILAKRLILSMKNGTTKKIKLVAFSNKKIQGLMKDLIITYPGLNIVKGDGGN